LLLALPPFFLQAFVLAVNLRFQNELQKLHFLSIWQPLAEYVKAAEPVALAFEVLQADNDPCNIMVYERCVLATRARIATSPVPQPVAVLRTAHQQRRYRWPFR
jgi:hypothetical protein